ncbi:MAG: YifB family Mg chelatase-like AAA ATPase [Tannerellaceae bacterium]|nr:YifB family Mg chelatase-like AAA ATPase [Tannerellaceae bacterium]
MLVKIYGAALEGISAIPVTIEVSSTRGVQYLLVGLADAAVKESHERIFSAIQVSGYKLPQSRIVINMAPADIRKEGSSYDLPLAIGLLAATEQIKADGLERWMMMGELSLDGTLQPVKGALPIAIKAREAGYEGLIVPLANAREAGVVNRLKVYGARQLGEVVEFLSGKPTLSPVCVDTRQEFYERVQTFEYDFAEVKGQENVKRALEVAAAGGHNLLMVGPPGSGKSMMAKRLPSILPPLTLEESLETTKIHSVAGKVGGDRSLIWCRPFRSPHHSISNVAMIGGGTYPQPGEISLAHNGVLFLDELPEFNKGVLEMLRQPLEERVIQVSRARFSVEYPAGFMLIASMNPCPCGYYNHPDRECRCTIGQVQKYMNKVSGPLLDRIDIHIEIVPVPFDKIACEEESEKSEVVRQRVMRARGIQEERYRGYAGIYCNAQMNNRLLKTYATPDKESLMRLRRAMERLHISARAYHRILKVARTIADLAGEQTIAPGHISEAILYRNLDREGWGMMG